MAGTYVFKAISPDTLRVVEFEIEVPSGLNRMQEFRQAPQTAGRIVSGLKTVFTFIANIFVFLAKVIVLIVCAPFYYLYQAVIALFGLIKFHSRCIFRFYIPVSLAVVLAVSALIFCGYMIYQKSKFDKYFNLCSQSINNGLYEPAIEHCDKALKVRSDDVTALNLKGNAFYGLNRYEEAVKYYDKALGIAPEDSVLLANQCDALQKLGEHQEVIKYLGKHQAAIKYCDKALSLNPSDTRAQALKNASMVVLRREQEKRELDLMTPKTADEYYSRGIRYETLRFFEEALSDFSKCVKVDQHDNVSCYQKRQAIYAALGRKDEAAKNLEILGALSETEKERKKIFQARTQFLDIKKQAESVIKEAELDATLPAQARSRIVAKARKVVDGVDENLKGLEMSGKYLEILKIEGNPIVDFEYYIQECKRWGYSREQCTDELCRVINFPGPTICNMKIKPETKKETKKTKKSEKEKTKPQNASTIAPQAAPTVQETPKKPDADTTAEIAKGLSDYNSGNRLQALQALRKIGRPALPYIGWAAVSDGNASIRLEAIMALAKIGAPALNFLCQVVLQDDRSTNRLEAIWALKNVGRPSIKCLSQVAAGDGNSGIRAEALVAIEEIGKQ